MPFFAMSPLLGPNLHALPASAPDPSVLGMCSAHVHMRADAGFHHKQTRNICHHLGACRVCVPAHLAAADMSKAWIALV